MPQRSPEGKPEFSVRSQHFTAVGDSLVVCRFTSERGFGLYVEEPYARMVRAVAGFDMALEELERVGERVINLERLFNTRAGVRGRTMSCPGGSCTSPSPTGPRRACTAAPRSCR